LTPLPTVIRPSTAKTVPIALKSPIDRPVIQPSVRKAGSVANETTASVSCPGRICRSTWLPSNFHTSARLAILKSAANPASVAKATAVAG
jgi:hypothetical protein